MDTGMRQRLGLTHKETNIPRRLGRKHKRGTNPHKQQAL